MSETQLRLVRQGLDLWCHGRRRSAENALSSRECSSVLQCVAQCCSVGGAVWCSVVQCGAICCSVLQCVAEHRRVQHTARQHTTPHTTERSQLPCTPTPHFPSSCV